jgi:signal transduction histidine kinase
VILVSVIIGVLVVGLAVFLGPLLAIQLTRPISELTIVTQKFAEGDLDARAAYTGTNEVGVLGAAFNQMADELQDTLKSLEASVKEARTATAMAREANRLKSEFLSTMSHELRTPLNAIVGFTEILMAGMSGEMPEKQLYKIRRIHLNSKRLLDLINDLLDLAKIEAGRVEVLHEQFSVRELAQLIQSQTESLAEQRGLDYSVQVDPDLPSLLIGDAARIEQIAKNLVSNAFKFTKEGSVEVQFNSDGGRTWNLSVKDTGIGIPAHALEYIFDEFRQVDGSSQRAYGGSGLGLAITRNLARIMDGEVRVTSKLGEGSTFIVTLPLVVAEPDTIVAGGRA